MNIGDSLDIILVEVLNSRVGSEIYDLVVVPYREQQNNDNGKTLSHLCEIKNSQIMNGFY